MEEAWPPRGAAAVPRLALLRASPHFQSLEARLIRLSLACLHQMGGEDDGFHSRRVLGKGLGPQPHGESAWTSVSPLPGPLGDLPGHSILVTAVRELLLLVFT